MFGSPRNWTAAGVEAGTTPRRWTWTRLRTTEPHRNEVPPQPVCRFGWLAFPAPHGTPRSHKCRPEPRLSRFQALVGFGVDGPTAIPMAMRQITAREHLEEGSRAGFATTTAKIHFDRCRKLSIESSRHRFRGGLDGPTFLVRKVGPTKFASICENSRFVVFIGDLRPF